MSRKKIRATPRRVMCPQCKAEVGDPCVTRFGRVMIKVHKRRRKRFETRSVPMRRPKKQKWRGRARPKPPEQAYLCPYCGATPGTKCINRDGGQCQKPHSARIALVRNAVRLARFAETGDPLNIACPFCGVPPGNPCMQPNGSQTKTHLRRLK